MKKVMQLILLAILLCSCNNPPDCNKALNLSERELQAGNLSRVIYLADSIRTFCTGDRQAVIKADSLRQMAERISFDFSVNEEEVRNKIAVTAGPFTEEEFAGWEAKGWLEGKVLDGEKRYFRRAASNLLLIRNFHNGDPFMIREDTEDPGLILRKRHTEDVLESTGAGSTPVVPVNFEINYTVTVKPDAVPEGETVRCWLPWPKSNHQRQGNVRLLGTSSDGYFISPDSAIHSTIYMEKKAVRGSPSVFSVSFRFRSSAQYFNMNEQHILPYNTASDLYKKYTSEQLPQINFGKNVRLLADSITGDDRDPVSVVRKIYMWFKGNVPWTGALEYSIMNDIPGYVCHYRRGDCGMQTFLFMSMLRYKGIPVKWQSGWMLPPGDENLHDWCEVYFEGAGWIPVDVSYDLQDSENRKVREFYLSGIDAYRMILNDGVAGQLYPHKNFMRSEPYDFQRGEVEWKGGNLYFDKWSYDISIKILKDDATF